MEPDISTIQTISTSPLVSYEPMVYSFVFNSLFSLYLISAVCVLFYLDELLAEKFDADPQLIINVKHTTTTKLVNLSL